MIYDPNSGLVVKILDSCFEILGLSQTRADFSNGFIIFYQWRVFIELFISNF